MKSAAVAILCCLLAGCAVVHLRRQKWPPADEVKTWHFDWKGDERDGCDYIDWYKRENCAQRHTKKL